ncbi:metallophosphoesterase [Peribacillus cavernae]|uniref:Metallophosphoesterase n=1 Tax=Peribacillus cavernae TaxID=1674310 RepID=A0A3S0TYC7_9BACI|nr:metallophosphoesterase [Peribacillus cavernae]MDQ0217270.1 putative MPP superfamily phosphohydrolase [Peribacillus cavernae]RUQ30263.1 metallophosphoesterase [Peribacillus cavernae]
MEKNISRRAFIKRAFGAILAVSGISFGSRYYCHEIEPKWLDIATISISNPLIPKGFNGLRIVQFSDTHLGFQFQLSDLEYVTRKINALNPDVIFFTGDLMDEPNQYRFQKEIIPVMKQLQAPLGKFCIYGNHDHGGYGSEIYSSIMQKADFQVLRNSNANISLLNGESIYVAGIDDPMLGHYDFESTLKDIPKKTYTILLSHAPDLADTSTKYEIHLQLSGHSHGGQVQIPFAGALITPPFAEKYKEGTFEIGKLKLHVNRGLGTTRLPYRFLSRPEITVYELHSL